MASLFDELQAREAAARARVEELEAEIAELMGRLEAERERLFRLMITRETVSELAAEGCVGEVRQAGESARPDGEAVLSPFAGVETRVVGVLTVPRWQPGLTADVPPSAARTRGDKLIDREQLTITTLDNLPGLLAADAADAGHVACARDWSAALTPRRLPVRYSICGVEGRSAAPGESKEFSAEAEVRAGLLGEIRNGGRFLVRRLARPRVLTVLQVRGRGKARCECGATRGTRTRRAGRRCVARRRGYATSARWSPRFRHRSQTVGGAAVGSGNPRAQCTMRPDQQSRRPVVKVPVAGSVVPRCREGLAVDVLAPDYQRLVGVLEAGAGMAGLCAKDLAGRLGLELTQAKVEGVRSKAKRLVERGWLAEERPGVFMPRQSAG